MTMEDELRALTSATAAVDNEQKRNRSNFRSPIQNWEGDVVAVAGPFDVARGNQTQRVVRLRVENLIVTKSVQPYTDSVVEFEMNLPKEANVHGEIGQMVASAKAINDSIDSLLDLRGKHLNCEEKVHTYPGRRNTNVKDSRGKDIWADEDFTTTYYHVNAIGGAGNGSAAPAAPAEANPDAVAAVLAFANGLTEDQFNQSVLRDVPAAAQDAVTRGKILSRTFLKEAVEAGQLELVDGTYTYSTPEAAVTA